ncbi:MAG: tripartite tricarboxylate transporter TctB family protein [Rhodospirillales bacterium]|nr:tripartite tricarboxylate transporter TctB family protein [Rhodospirillales bacterium]
MKFAAHGVAWPDWVAAGAMIGLGAFGVAESLQYGLGVLRNIGPGTFPLIVSTFIFAAGWLILVEGVMATAPSVQIKWAPPRVLLFILAGLLSFAFLAQRFGLVPGIFGCVILSCMAEGRLKWWQVLAIAAVLSGFSAFVFVEILSLPLRLVRW